MSRVTSNGNCELCGKSYRKSGMSRHLKSCLTKTAGADDKPGQQNKSIHLLVEDTDRPEYWLHLAVPEAMELAELDQYLRDIWLECCLHLSTFDIRRTFYDRVLFDDDDFLILDDQQGMDVALGRVAPVGTRFSHRYDFGTTTELAIRSLAEVDGWAEEIRLLARNHAPAIDCSICGAPAMWVGPSEDDWIAITAGLCDACASTSEYRLPIVNSPRSGVCGYDGTPMQVIDGDDDEWPYDEPR